jgi:hypothetical protein
MRAAIGVMLLAMTSMTLGAACSSSTTYSGLPYRPEVPVTGAPISAAYTIASDRLRVEIDTGGRRLERAQIVKTDGFILEAQTIEYAEPSAGGGSPVSIGIGIGSFGGLGGGVSTGVGVSTSGVVGGSGSSVRANTIAAFPLDQSGPRPWRVRVKLGGMEPVDIVVGTP